MKLLGLIGKEIASAEVCEAIKLHALNEIDDDPPFRRYIGSKRNGLDLLLEDDKVVAVQIFVRPIQGYSSFGGELPLGLDANMTVSEVLRILGPPLRQDMWTITYLRDGAQIVINCDDDSRITYLNIGHARVGA